MKTPEEKYMYDANYRALVDTLENFIHINQYTPSEIREAAMFACIKHEMRKPILASIFNSSEADKSTINNIIKVLKTK